MQHRIRSHWGYSILPVAQWRTVGPQKGVWRPHRPVVLWQRRTVDRAAWGHRSWLDVSATRPS